MASQPRIEQTSHQSQQLLMSVAMESAFHVLQLPVSELSHYIDEEVQKNPLLEKNLEKAAPGNAYDIPLKAKPSLYTHLVHEISYHFESREEIALASYIAGSLDEKGFLTLSEGEVCLSQKVSIQTFRRVLNTLQHIEPLGVGSRNIQEALLIQLKDQGKEKSIVFEIVAEHFNDLKNNKLEKISRGYSIPVSKLKKLINSHLKPLSPFPGHEFIDTHNTIITPDLHIEREDTQWTLRIEKDSLPSFQFHGDYLRVLEEDYLPGSDVDFMRRYLAAGKWLRRTINRRESILRDIGLYLIKKQEAYLDGIDRAPAPMSMIEVAKALELSPSTVTRAVANKYLACPRGIIKVREMFTQGIVSEKGVVSNQCAKDLILQLIKEENKASPLSDQELKDQMRKYGIACARRTIAKYRKALQIATASKRRES